MPEKEVRMSEFRNLSDAEMTIEGYAATFENPTVLYKYDGVEYKEVIDKTAFSKTEMKDCCLKYNHSDHVPILARKRGNSLSLSVDEIGLFFRAKLFDTQSARDVYKLVKEGALNRCSFSFVVAPGGAYYDGPTHTRHLMDIETLYDVSVVDIPAYDTTSVNARALFSLDSEKERLDSLKRQRLQTKIEITRIIYGGLKNE